MVVAYDVTSDRSFRASKDWYTRCIKAIQEHPILGGYKQIFTILESNTVDVWDSAYTYIEDKRLCITFEDFYFEELIPSCTLICLVTNRYVQDKSDSVSLFMLKT